MALTVAGILVPPSYCASFRAARIAAMIPITRLRLSSTLFNQNSLAQPTWRSLAATARNYKIELAAHCAKEIMFGACRRGLCQSMKMCS